MSHSHTDCAKPQSTWGSSYRLIASEKWKAKSAVMGGAVTEAIVDYAAPQLGMNVLDLASGTGEPAISIALRVGATGHVTALDLSSELLNIAESRARERGLANFTTQEADAHSLPFAEETFDLATSRFGIMFFRDVDLTLGELLRVLRSNARACFVAWGPFEQPYWQSTMGIVQRYVGGPLFEPGSANPFRFSSPGSLGSALKAAGFRNVHEETKTVPWTWPGTPEEVWEQVRSVAVPFHPLLDRVSAESWPHIDSEVHSAIRKYVSGENIEFGATIVLASGTK